MITSFLLLLFADRCCGSAMDGEAITISFGSVRDGAFDDDNARVRLVSTDCLDAAAAAIANTRLCCIASRWCGALAGVCTTGATATTSAGAATGGSTAMADARAGASAWAAAGAAATIGAGATGAASTGAATAGANTTAARLNEAGAVAPCR